MDSLNDLMSVAYGGGILIVMVAIVLAIFALTRKKSGTTIASLVVGLLGFLFMTFVGSCQVSQSDLVLINRQHYSTYTVAKDNVDVYKIGGKSYSKDGADGSQRADIQASVGSKAKYRVEVITYGLSKAKKQAWRHSLNLSKVMAAHQDLKQYVVKINN